MKAFLFIFGIIFHNILAAQVLDFPSIHTEDFKHNVYSLDSSASAIVLREAGTTQLDISSRDNGLRIFHTFKTRIHILKSDGYDEANFTIPLYKVGNDFEYVEDIEATTFNIEGNKLTGTALDKKNIIYENKSEYLKLTKFTLPNVKVGSIIEVKYRIISPDIFNYRSWNFQSKSPKLFSTYQALIPAITKYNVVLKGGYKLTDTKSKLRSGCFAAIGIKADCSEMTYTMTNIPAFKEEAYMLAPKNYISSINFELEEMTNPNGGTTKYTKTWENVDRELMLDRNFGGQLKKENFFKEFITTENILGKSDYEKANNIYQWLKTKIKWNNYYGKYAQNGVEDAVKRRSGNVADINLALVAALNAAGIEAFPVIISTRDNGLPHNLHPVISNFNYVIAAAKIDDNTILLDATDPMIGFGDLPLRCINDKGRIIYSRKSSEWIPLIIKSIATTNISFEGKMEKDGKVNGNLSILTNGIDAYQKRREILNYASQEEYYEKLDERLTNIDIQNSEITNLEDPNMALIENMSVAVKLADKQSNKIYLNPIFINKTTKNPFNLDERLYAVDLGAKKDENFEIAIDLPEGFVFENGPKNTSMALPNNAARYVYKSEIKDNKLYVNLYLSLKKAVYEPDEYFGLKEFFSRIIQHQKIDYVFKTN